MVTFRKMLPDEAITVKKIAKKAFGWLESFGISTPKDAIVAVSDNQIVGGIILKYIMSSGKKIGYFSGAFIDPDYHGQGIGSALYRETTNFLWEQGCDALSAIVKDDNVASWKLLLNNGFSRIGIWKGIEQLGFWAMLHQYFTTLFYLSNGMEFYLTVKDRTILPKSSKTIPQICLYIAANLLLMLPALVRGISDLKMYLAAYLFLLAGGVLFGYIGTLFSKRQWQFRLNSGGAVLLLLLNLCGVVYPLIGNWYPTAYEKSGEFKKDMGLTALCEWIFIFCITLVSFWLRSSAPFFHYLSRFGEIFLIYRIFLFYPFESYGANRLYHWRKEVYFILSVLSLLVVSIF